METEKLLRLTNQTSTN